MNKIKGVIKNITTSGELSLVEVSVAEDVFSAVIIGSDADFLKQNNPVCLLFKETEVALGKGDNYKISLRNKLNCFVKEIKRGVILSCVSLNYGNLEIMALITSSAVEDLSLIEGEPVTAFIKTNEIMIMEVEYE